jgi:hypothetical protein
MTIRKTSKPCIGGATPQRDRTDLATDDRPVNSPQLPALDLILPRRDVRNVCGDLFANRDLSEDRIDVVHRPPILITI